MANEGLKTLTVAAVLCVVCSVIVSGTAVKLKPLQVKNKEIDVKRNILLAAKMIDDKATSEDVQEEFKKVQTVLINMDDGSLVQGQDPSSFDASKVEQTKIPSNKDIAGLSTKPKIVKAYIIKEDEEVKDVILPVISKGLWSTMYAFMALEGDGNTIKGFSYYSHGETPGLGGEVDNPNWKALWVGKKIYNDEMEPEVAVVKHVTDQDHHVDALSGATITGAGVSSSLQYWFGSDAYKPFLEKVKAGEI